MQWPPAELPGGGQPVGDFSPSELAHGGVAGEEEEQKWGRAWERGSEGHLGVQVCS